MRWLSVTLALLVVSTACDGGADRVEDRAVRAPAAAPAAPVPEARTEVGAARLGDRIVVVGGLRADGSATDRVDVFDLAAGTWSAGPALPRPLHHPGVAAFDGRLVVAGGYLGDGATWVESAEVWSLGREPAEGWRAEPALATARGALGLAATDEWLVAFGGTSAGQVLTSVEVLVRGTDSWRTAPPLRQAREHAAATVVDDRVYAIGGRVGGLETNLVSVESMEPAAFPPAWRPEPDLRTARGGIAAATVEGRPCVAGGESPAGTIASVECLDRGRWREVATLTEARHGLGVVAGRDGRLHVLAGGPQPGLFVSTAHEVLTPFVRPGRAPGPARPGST